MTITAMTRELDQPTTDIHDEKHGIQRDKKNYRDCPKHDRILARRELQQREEIVPGSTHIRIRLCDMLGHAGHMANSMPELLKWARLEQLALLKRVIADSTSAIRPNDVSWCASVLRAYVQHEQRRRERHPREQA